MGLLDKVDNLEEAKPKKATPKKAVAKKATPKKAVAKKATPKASKAKSNKSRDKESLKADKVEKIRPTGLPEGFELSGKMPRYIGWLINFGWNFGIAIFLLSIIGSGADPDLTIPWAGAALMIIFNWFVLPIWTGRNIGEFVSQTKYMNSSGNRPNASHAVLNNSLGFLSLIGMVLMMAKFQTLSSDMPIFITGAVLVLIWIVNFFFKKNSDYSQGLFDIAFSAYLVRHVSTGEATGWLAKFESLGDLGAKWEQRQESRQEKARIKAEEKAARAAESSEDTETAEEESED